MPVHILNVIKIIAPAAVAFATGVLATPLLTHYLYKYQMWKKEVRTKASDGADISFYKSINQGELSTPKMGGVVVWGSALFTILLFWFGSLINGETLQKLNFLSRGQTWLPLFTLLAGAAIGLVDDYFEVSGRLDYFAGGLSLRKRLLVVAAIGLIGAWWFYEKLEVSSVIVPFIGEWNIGILFIPFFVAVMLATYAGGIIDGIDGLSGGVFAAIFGAYGAIAFAQNQIDLAAFSFVLVGGLLAFLWFNIPPARFYLSETGSMALTVTLTVIVFLTKQVFVLPIIAFLLFATAASSTLQLASKKFRGKQLFIAAPVHYHFQALGWPPYKVVMRYWVLALMFAIVGLIVAFIGQPPV